MQDLEPQEPAKQKPFKPTVELGGIMAGNLQLIAQVENYQ